mgnify:CR=1 FL=1
MLAGGRYTRATLLNASSVALSARALRTQVRRSARGRRTRTASCGRAASCRQQRRCSPPSASSWTAGWCLLQPRPPDASSSAAAVAAGLSQRASTWTDGADGRRSRPRSPAISRGPRGNPDRLVDPRAPPSPHPRPQWPWRVAGTSKVATVGDRAALLATVARTWSIVSPRISQSRAISRSGGHATIISAVWDGAGGSGAWCGGVRRGCARL